jgi:hypothetical protein
MADIVERRRNLAPWMAFLFTLAALGLNAWTFVVAGGTRIVLLLSFVAGLCALVYGIIGVRRAFGRPQIFRGKISSSIFAVLAVLVCGLMVFAWFQSRALPASTGAPRVGAKAPDFTLTDTQGRSISLAQLLGHGDLNGTANTNGAAPKAVLLIFYRGYW